MPQSLCSLPACSLNGVRRIEWSPDIRMNAVGMQAHRPEQAEMSVKAGDIVNPHMVRDLGRVMERDGHRFGLFVMKGLPTKGMRDEAASQRRSRPSSGDSRRCSS